MIRTSIGRVQTAAGYQRDAWLDKAAAASLRRVDYALGFILAVVWAGRSWAEQNAMWIKYGRNPKRAAPPGSSIHEEGRSIDVPISLVTRAFIRLMNEHGWYQTVKGEAWHFTYLIGDDQHINDPAPPLPVEEPEDEEDDTMKVFGYIRKGDGRKWYVTFDFAGGLWGEFVTEDEDYARSVAVNWGRGAPLLSEGHRDQLAAAFCQRWPELASMTVKS